MTWISILLGAGAFIAMTTLVMTVINLRTVRSRMGAAAEGEVVAGAEGGPLVSVCIPARNEEENLRGILESLLASDERDIEILVYDDQSTDRTPKILAEFVSRDARVRRVDTALLPEGWNGKQHACWRMSREACGAYMLFTDADVRFAPSCIRETLKASRELRAPLVSAFPRQETHSAGEKLIVPMIFFVLLSYLPFPRMRRTNDPGTSAGCGQFLFIRRDAYEASGGHNGFRDSMHDGIMLPRAVRRAGFHSDLFDATDLCHCRMYRDWRSTWRGFAKNAYEGLGSPGLLVFITLVHAIGHVLPWLVGLAALAGWATVGRADMVLCAVAVSCAVVQRLIMHAWSRHPAWLALVHPVSIVLMTVIQWHSFVLQATGKRSWRGRVAGAKA